MEKPRGIHKGEALTETYSLICHLMKRIQSGHPTRLKSSSVLCSIPSAAAVPLPHCTFGPHQQHPIRKSNCTPQRTTGNYPDLHGGLGRAWGRHLPAASSAFISPSIYLAGFPSLHFNPERLIKIHVFHPLPHQTVNLFLPTWSEAAGMGIRLLLPLSR